MKTLVTKVAFSLMMAMIIIGIFSSCHSISREKKEKINAKFDTLIRFCGGDYIVKEYLKPSEEWNKEQATEIEKRALSQAIRELNDSQNVYGIDFTNTLPVLRKYYCNNSDSIANIVYQKANGEQLTAKYLNTTEVFSIKKIIHNKLTDQKSFNQKMTWMVQLEPDTTMKLVRTGYYSQHYLEGFLRWDIAKVLRTKYFQEILGYVKDSTICNSINEWIDKDHYFWAIPTQRKNHLLMQMSFKQLHYFMKENDSIDKIIKKVVNSKVKSIADAESAWYYSLISEDLLIKYYRGYPLKVLIEKWTDGFTIKYVELLASKINTNQQYTDVVNLLKDNTGYIELLRKLKGCN